MSAKRAKFKVRRKFANSVERCDQEWSNNRPFRPTTHVCALEFEYKNRCVCMCGERIKGAKHGG